MKIITSPNCVKVEIKTVGIADQRRPNGKKPLYRRVVKYTPTAYYLVAKQTIVCHPSILEKLKADLAKKKQDAVEKTRATLNDMMQNFTYSTFGIDQASKPDETAVATITNGVFQPRVLNNPYFNPTGT